MHEAKLHTKGLERMLSASKLEEISSSPGSLSLKGMDKRLLLLSACWVSWLSRRLLGIQAQASTGRGTACGSVNMIPGDVRGSG